MAKDDDEILVPKAKAARPGASGPSKKAKVRRVMQITRLFGIALGGFVTLVGVMGVVGLATDNFWARLIVALVVVLGLPAFLADRMLKRASSGGLAMVGDVFAIVLLGIALVFVAANAVTRGLLAGEGDRYARSGSTGMARVAYFLAGVSPVFPGEEGAAPADAKAPDAGAADAGAK